VFADAVRPNAFGLTIAHDPYAWEFCSTPNVFRGGDGGTSWCGGDGSLAIWSTLGTPYRRVLESRTIINPFTKREQTLDGPQRAAIRRVYPLSRIAEHRRSPAS
jgi:hypothetical protein